MAEFSNGQLAQQITDLISFWSTFNEEYKNWLGGTVSGGPSNDGKYPLTDYTGTESLVDCPAKLSDAVSGYVGDASGYADDAAASAVAAALSETNAAASAVTATAQAVLADADRVAAQLAESGAVDAKVTAIAQAAAALVSATNAASSESNAATSETNAAASAAAAAASEAAAATFNPALFAALADNETITGQYTFSNAQGVQLIGSATTYLTVDAGNSSSAAGVLLKSGGVNAWFLTKDSTGNDDFKISKYSDLGAQNGTPFKITRATGDITIAYDLDVTGDISGANLNISNWDTAFSWGDPSGTYLPLVGGTLATDNGHNPLVLNRGNATSPQVSLRFLANTTDRYFGAGTDNEPYWSSVADITGSGNKMYHEGNFIANSDYLSATNVVRGLYNANDVRLDAGAVTGTPAWNNYSFSLYQTGATTGDRLSVNFHLGGYSSANISYDYDDPDYFQFDQGLSVNKSLLYPLLINSGSTNLGRIGIEFDGSGTSNQKGQFVGTHSNVDSNDLAYSFHFSSTEATLGVILDGAGDFYVGTDKLYRSGNFVAGSQYVSAGARLTGDAGDVLTTSVRLWDVSTGLDMPASGQDGILTTGMWDSTSYGSQQFHDFHTNTIHIRQRNAGVWGSWDKVLTASNAEASHNHSDYVSSTSDDTKTGNLVFSDSERNDGIYGVYDSTKMQHIWSMGTNFKILADGSDYGNLYGAVYRYHSSEMAKSHQFVWCQNGSPKVALGSNIWTSGTLTASTAYVSTVDLGAPTLSANGNYTRIQTAYGYGDIGSNNSSYFHFYTDRATFFFSKQLAVQGNVFPHTTLNNSLGDSSHTWETGYIQDLQKTLNINSAGGQKLAFDTGTGYLSFKSASATASSLVLRTSDDAIRGYLYVDSSNNIGTLNNSGIWSFRVSKDGDALATRDITSGRYLSIGGTGNGYFFTDSSGRTAFAGGDFYIQSSVGTYFNYATNQYLGGSAGDDNIRIRSNFLYGDNWQMKATGEFVGTKLTISGDIYANGSYIYGDNKRIVQYTDGWMRLNPNLQFTSGIYCSTSILRTDGQLQVGNSGDKFLAHPDGYIKIRSGKKMGKLFVQTTAPTMSDGDIWYEY